VCLVWGAWIDGAADEVEGEGAGWVDVEDEGRGWLGGKPLVARGVGKAEEVGESNPNGAFVELLVTW